ncbi:hypothetical protein MIR68_011059 [Amoeboaphelidium protococcarum]|nr:hypothetical protein MIR68_011059 [Amoeboaphelidium protococcarum]
MSDEDDQNSKSKLPLFPMMGSIQRASSSSNQEKDYLSPVRPVVSSRKKVELEPGFSPLDWAVYSRDRKQNVPQKFTMDQVAQHKTQDDAWLVLHGKVYNITPYLRYHPGGVQMLMGVAGKDATQKFLKYHAWVNADHLLEKCLLGYLTRQ